MKKYTIAVILLASLGLAGCGHTRPSEVSTASVTPIRHSKPGDVVHWERLNDNTFWVTVDRDNRTLNCFEDLQPQSGSITISCNWEVFNAAR